MLQLPPFPQTKIVYFSALGVNVTECQAQREGHPHGSGLLEVKCVRKVYAKLHMFALYARYFLQI